jgi:uncharacterized damage-inducible protein DinB
MNSIDVLKNFARYNAWVNEKIYATCATIPDSKRKRDLGAFFHSIHATLNHVLLGDRLWLGRLTGVEFPVRTLGDELYADFDELRRERVITDGDLINIFADYNDADIGRDLNYTSVSTGKVRSYPLHHVLLHLCNHQTHHRGQVTAMIQRLGFDYGDIDLLFMPHQ